MAQGTLTYQQALAYAGQHKKITYIHSLNEEVIFFTDELMPGAGEVPIHYVQITTVFPRTIQGRLIHDLETMVKVRHPNSVIADDRASFEHYRKMANKPKTESERRRRPVEDDNPVAPDIQLANELAGLDF